MFCGDERGEETTGEKGHGVIFFFVAEVKGGFREKCKPTNGNFYLKKWGDGRGDFWGSMLNVFTGDGRNQKLQPSFQSMSYFLSHEQWFHSFT